VDDHRGDRGTAEMALGESEGRFRLLVEGTKDYAIFMLDPGGHIVSWNAGAERINGYNESEIVGRHFSVFYTEADLRSGKPERELTIARATGKYEEEGWRVRKDGSRFWTSVVITALYNPDGALTGFGKVTRDLTERQRLEQSLREKNAALEAALRSKDQFLASMSHELRTPLNAIIGFAGTLLMRLPGPLTDEQEKQLRTVQSSARHLVSLINDLLDLAKMNSGKIEVRPEPVDCGQVLEEVATTLRPLAAQKGLTLDVRTPARAVVVDTDRRALSQILLNLGNNACKFTEHGGVTLELEAGGPAGSAAEFRVTDTGVGIRAEDQARLFQPFVRLAGGEIPDQAGSGLGLHLSQRLAELMGGRITLESEYGRGSRFNLTLGRA
jgi:protein-histidine pros-kinase